MHIEFYFDLQQFFTVKFWDTVGKISLKENNHYMWYLKETIYYYITQ